MSWFRRQILLRRLRNVSLRSITIIMILMVIVSNEYLIYWIQSRRWPNMLELSRNPNKELVILLVSDPQLIGIQDEHGFPIGPIARWDSDRFMQKTFSLAYSYSEPDVVIFLGDLMDEGSKAFNYEYESYLSRFQDIFYPSLQSRTIYIPGDNDVGGEGFDFRTKFKVGRFERHFENLTGVVNINFVDFIKLDFRSQVDSFLAKKEDVSSITKKLTAPVRIILNHEPVISQPKMFVYPLLKQVQPNLAFTGHWHESFHYVCETCLSSNADSSHWPVHTRDLRKLQGWTEADFTNLLSVNEFMVPTCSYRMGTQTMGYGVAVINKAGSMQYTVLWLPHRYTQLYAYVICLIAIVIIDFFLYIFIFVNKRHRR